MGRGPRRFTATREAAAFALVAAIHTPKGANENNSQGNDNENEEEVGISIAVVGTTIIRRNCRTCRGVASEVVAVAPTRCSCVAPCRGVGATQLKGQLAEDTSLFRDGCRSNNASRVAAHLCRLGSSRRGTSFLHGRFSSLCSSPHQCSSRT